VTIRRGPSHRCAAAAVALLALAVSLLPDAAGAQAEPPAFVRGGASAQADTLGLNIVTSGATIGLTLGRSLAQYRDRSASSEGRALDLGALSVLFGELSRCDATKPLLPKESLPPVTAADSSESGSGASHRTQVFFPGLRGVPSTMPAGFQDATASAQPASRATTETVYQDISFFTLTNARTETTARLTGNLREARAVTAADEMQMMNGMFRFVNPRWEAVAHSGSTEDVAGQFTFDTAYVFGIPRTHDQILADVAGFSQGLSAALGGLGVHIDLPQVEVEGRTVRVTPMAFRITDPPIGAAALTPFFNNIQPLYDIMSETLVKQDCKNQSTLQLLDVVLQVLKGSGSIVIPVGGVEATTDDKYFPPPAIVPPPSAEQPEAPIEEPPTTVAEPFVPVGDVGTDLPTGGDFVPSVSTDPGPEVEAAVETTEAPVDDHEVAAADIPVPPAAISSRFEDGSTGGTATVVGIIALAVVLSLAAGDRWIMRRTRRRIE
jgi:hypothetical protein